MSGIPFGIICSCAAWSQMRKCLAKKQIEKERKNVSGSLRNTVMLKKTRNSGDTTVLPNHAK
jgi:hypothetical protein